MYNALFQMKASQNPALMGAALQNRIIIALNKEDARYMAGEVMKGLVTINFPQEIRVKGKRSHCKSL